MAILHEKKVSVLIPVYQVEADLFRCVDSVLSQTHPNLEIILMDDGSTDGSPQICEHYSELSNVTYIPGTHHGLSYVRQRLVENATGDYVFFVDSDDFIHPQTIECLLEIAVSKGLDLVQCKTYHWMPGTVIENQEEQPVLEIYPKENLITKFCCGTAGSLRCMMWGKLYRKEVFKNVQFPNGKIHEDEFAIHQILGNCNAVGCFSQKMYYYADNPNGIIKRPFSCQKYDILFALENRISFCREHSLDFAADMAMLHFVFMCVELYRKSLEHFGKEDSHLSWLYNEMKGKIPVLLSKSWFDEDVTDLLKRWLDDPTSGPVPRYWDIAHRCYEKWEQADSKLSV